MAELERESGIKLNLLQKKLDNEILEEKKKDVLILSMHSQLS
jgi:hypothetical protein